MSAGTSRASRPRRFTPRSGLVCSARPVLVDRSDPAARDAAAAALPRGASARPPVLLRRAERSRRRHSPAAARRPDRADGLRAPGRRDARAERALPPAELLRAASRRRSAFLPSWAQRRRARAEGGVMIIDCHCHAGTGDGLTGPWDTAAPLEPYLRRARAPASRARCCFAAFHSDYASPTARSARIVAARPRPLLRLRVRARGARPRADRRARRRGRRAHRLPRHQGPPPRRPHHPRDLRGGARFRPARALRRDGRGLGGRAARHRVPGRRLHHPAPRQLRRRLARAARRRRPARAPSRTSTPTPRACAASTCSWTRSPPGGPRARSCSAPTGRGCTPASSSPRSALLGLPPAQEALVLGGNLLRLISRARVSSARPRPRGADADSGHGAKRGRSWIPGPGPRFRWGERRCFSEPPRAGPRGASAARDS